MTILEDLQKAAKKQILYLPHALQQMSREDRMISTEEVRQVLAIGEVIEDYPNDPGGAELFAFRI